jgi:hypothetical protein
MHKKACTQIYRRFTPGFQKQLPIFSTSKMAAQQGRTTTWVPVHEAIATQEKNIVEALQDLFPGSFSSSTGELAGRHARNQSHAQTCAGVSSSAMRFPQDI